MDQLLTMNIKFYKNTVQLHQKHIQELQSYLNAIVGLQETPETLNKEAVGIDMMDGLTGAENVESYPEFASQNSIWDRIHAAHSPDAKDTEKKNSPCESNDTPLELIEQSKIPSDMKQNDTPLINEKQYPTINSLMKYGPHEQQRIKMNIFQQAIDNIDNMISVNPESVADRDIAINSEADRLLQVWLNTH
jgi:hypothetical protein